MSIKAHISSDASVQIACENQYGYVSSNIFYIVCTVTMVISTGYTVLLLSSRTCMQNKTTPVYKAAQQGHVEALSTLISAGANFNSANVVSIECVTY